jgi:hypothetical protein
MSELHEKTRVYDLFGCTTAICPVAMFIQVTECPVCHQTGILVRRADTFERGQPPDPTRFGAIESETD